MLYFRKNMGRLNRYKTTMRHNKSQTVWINFEKIIYVSVNVFSARQLPDGTALMHTHPHQLGIYTRGLLSGIFSNYPNEDK